MKTPAIIALSIIGVLATTGAAMAVNGATLAAFNQGTIGQATDVLVPTSTPSSTPSSTPTPTRGADDDNGLRGDGSVDDDSDSTDGVPSPSPTHTSDDDDSYDDSDDDSDDDHSYDDSDEHEDESEDDD